MTANTDNLELSPETDNRLTVQEMVNSLLRFEEIAIKRAFGENFIVLSRTNAPEYGRALVFVAKRREGLSDAEAFNAVEAMTFGEVQAYFQPEPGDDDLEQPVTAAGKG